MAANRRTKVIGVGDQLLEPEVQQLLGLGLEQRLLIVTVIDPRLAAKRGERHSDQGQQAQHGQDEDKDDPSAFRVAIVF